MVCKISIMKYILSEEEYKSLVPAKEYEEMRSRLLDENARLENLVNALRSYILDNRPCPVADDSSDTYCKGCILSPEHLDICVGRYLNEQINDLII